MKKLILLIWSLLVVLMLLLPTAFWVGGYRAVEFENRPLAEFPIMTFDSIFRTASPGTSLDVFYRDHVPLRYELTRFYNQSRYTLLKESPSPQAIVGKDGWLFMADTVLEWPETPGAEPERVTTSLDSLIDFAAAAELSLVILFSPNKASLYSEFLPDGWQSRRIPIANARQKAFEEYAASTPEMLNMWEVLRDRKANMPRIDSGDNRINQRLRYLFRPRDRHWHWETGEIQASEIITVLGDNPKDVVFPSQGKYKYRNSELPHRFFIFELNEPYTGLDRKGVPICVNNRSTEQLKFCENPDAPFNKKIIVIHDSFMNASMPFLSATYSHIIYVHWNTVNLAIEELSLQLRSADGLVVQAVEGRKGDRVAIINNIVTYMAATD